MVSAVQSKLIDAQLAPAAIGSQIDAALAAKSLDSQKQEGAAILKLLDGAAQAGFPDATAHPNLGGLLDTTA